MKEKKYKDGIYDVVEWSNGAKEWYLNDNLHRNDGPAIEWSNGTKKWYLNDNLHRNDGPAVEWSNGAKEWYLNDKEIKQFICKFPHEDWVEIEALNYIGPYKRISKCFIELPIEVGGNKMIVG